MSQMAHMYKLVTSVRRVRSWRALNCPMFRLIVFTSTLLGAGSPWAIAESQLRPNELRAGEVLPLVAPPFQGKVGKTSAQSEPAFPPLIAPPKKAPNVILVLLDDVGFGHSSAFGGAVPTPSIEKLASQGLRYNSFHTTAICSPTRAALLSGRNQHRIGAGTVTESSPGYPGYDGIWGKDAASVAEVLRHHGYSTAMFGKWHNTPRWESGPMGPFDRWPVGKGFEYFYGFLGGDTDQFSPALYENTVPISAPKSDGYHLTTDLADRAINWIRSGYSTAPDKPFFLYFAPGATHAPLQAPAEWIKKFRGKFDHGWDNERELTFARQKELGVIPSSAALTPRPDELPAWNSFSANERKVLARMQEVYAGFLAHTDFEIGRVVEALNEIGLRENTMVIYIIGDNGASAEGSPIGTFNEMITINGLKPNMEDNLARIDQLGGSDTYSHFPAGWAWAGSTPFQYFKRVPSHLGAIRNGAIISWPERIQVKGAVRTQFHHVIDIMPTILEASGIPVPKIVEGVQQKSLDGVSMLYTFDQSDASSHRKTQYFEVGGYRGIYHDGWMASALHGSMPWVMQASTDESFEYDSWELYNLNEDFSQAHDLSGKYPAKLKKLQNLFDQEAERNQVYPLMETASAMRGVLPPTYAKDRTSFVYYPGMVRIVTGGGAPPVERSSFRIEARIGDQNEKVPEGVLLAQGGQFGGHVLYIQDGRLIYTYNMLGLEQTRIVSSEPLSTGPVTARLAFERESARPGSGAVARLFIDERLVGEGKVTRTVPYRFSLDETLDIGEDHGTAVDSAYKIPFRFSGDLRKVTIDIVP